MDLYLIAAVFGFIAGVTSAVVRIVINWLAEGAKHL